MKRKSNDSRNAKRYRPIDDADAGSEDRVHYSSLRYRDGVVKELCGLRAGSVVLVATELGMGRREVLADLAKEYLKLGCYVSYWCFDSCENVDSAALRLRSMIEDCVRSTCRAVTIIDNYPVPDDVYLEPLDDLVREASCLDVSVFVGSLPEGEVLFDGGVDLVSFWSSDFTIVRDNYGYLAGTQGYTNGIPALVFESAKAFSANISNPIMSPSFATAYATLVAHTQRKSLTREERFSCACMLLLGTGSIDDLRQVAGNVDTETYLRFARDEPILGVSRHDLTFSCAGSHDADAARICMTVFADGMPEWWRVLPDIVDVLMKRNDPERAARVCTGIPDTVARSKVALRYFFPMINAGMIGPVLNACSAVHSERYRGITGASECKSVLSSLLYIGRYDGMSSLEQLSANTVRGRYAELCVACREQLRGGAGRTLLRVRQEDDELSNALVMHGRILSCIVDGDVEAARRIAMSIDIEKGSASVLGVLLAADDLCCSILCGDVAGDSGREIITGQLAFLEGALPETDHEHFFPEVVRMLVRVARVLAGENDYPTDFDESYHHAVKHKDTMLCGFFLLGAAVAELRHEHWEGCNARLGLAIEYFMKSGADFYAHACYLLRYVMNVSQGGRAREGDLERCVGDSMEGDLLVAIIEDAATGRLQRDYVDMGFEEALSRPPTNVLWVTACILSCFGKFSARVFGSLPALWAGTCEHHLEAWGFQADTWKRTKLVEHPFTRAARTIAATGAYEKTGPVRIRMLGGFDVWVEGRPCTGGELDQRKAKMLLALLASRPTHWLSIVDCRNAMWPTLKKDLVRVKKNVSMAVGVLRSVLKVDRSKYGVDSVVSFIHGDDSRVRLDERLVVCDVDQFESTARLIVESRLDVRDIVKLGCKVDDLYMDGLYEFFDDASGITAVRKEDLEALFVDAMKIAAKAAEETRQLTCACRFAKKAFIHSQKREDLLSDLAMLLKKADRRDEAKDLLEKYINNMHIKKGGIGLSETLSKLSKELYGDDELQLQVLVHDKAVLEGVKIMNDDEWKRRHNGKTKG